MFRYPISYIKKGNLSCVVFLFRVLIDPKVNPRGILEDSDTYIYIADWVRKITNKDSDYLMINTPEFLFSLSSSQSWKHRGYVNIVEDKGCIKMIRILNHI